MFLLSSESVAAPSLGAPDFRCKECGYEIAIPEPHPICPMCGLGSWAPITAARRLAVADLRREMQP